MNEKPYDALITKLAAEYEIDPKLALAISRAENESQNPNAVSEAGALGIMQVMPNNIMNLRKQGKLPGQKLGTDPETNIRAGLILLKDYLGQAGGNVEKAVARYNNSQGLRYGEVKLADETEKYVPKVMATYAKFGGQVASPATSTEPVTINSQLEAVLSALTQSKEVSAATRKTLSSLPSDLAAGLQEIESAVMGKAEAEAAEIRLTAARTAEHAAMKRNILQRAQISEDGSGYFANALAQLSGIRVQKDEISDVIAQRQAVGFFDNPVEWMVNQMRLPGEIGQYNALNRAEYDAKENLAAVTQLTDKQIQWTDSLYTQKRADEILAAADARVEVARADAAKAKFENLSQSASLAMHMAALATSELNATVTTANLFEQQATREAQKKMQAVQLETLGLELSELKKKIKDSEEYTKSLQIFNQAFQADVTPETLSKLRPEQKDAIVSYVIGKQLGRNPLEMIKLLEMANTDMMRAKGNASQAMMVEEIRDLFAFQKNKIAADPEFKHRPINEQENAAAEAVFRLFSEAAEDPTRAVTTRSGGVQWNPYRAPHAILATDARFKDNIVAKAARAAQSAYPRATFISDEDIVTAALMLAGQQSIPMELVVKQITDYYGAVMDYNNKTHGMNTYNLPTQKTYKAQIGGLLGSNVTDLSSKSEVKKSVMKWYIGRTLNELGSPYLMRGKTAIVEGISAIKEGFGGQPTVTPEVIVHEAQK